MFKMRNPRRFYHEEEALRRCLRAGVRSITTRKLKLALALREEGKGNT